MIDLHGALSDVQAQLNTPGVKKLPTQTAFLKDNERKFHDILEQFVDDDPGITIDGTRYDDQNDPGVAMKVSKFVEDTKNVSSSFTKIDGVIGEVEKQIEKLIG